MITVSTTPRLKHPNRVSATGSSITLERAIRPRWLTILPWMVLLTVTFFTYSGSFSEFPVLEQNHSVLADADAANFALLVREFGLSRRFGDEYQTGERSQGDVAQKHKIHHVLYAIVASGTYTMLRPLYNAAGLEPERAVYGVNALIGCLNLIVLALLIRRLNPNGNPIWPFVLLYAFSLNVWIYSAIPESWPFTSLLVMTFLLATMRLRPVAAAALLGFFLLNNIFLSVLFAILAVEIMRRSTSVSEWLRSCCAAGAAMAGTWFLGLLALSAFDPSLNPINFIRFTFWFRDYASPGSLPIYDPYVVMSVLSNTFVTSVVSNQSDLFVPQESMLYTLQGGGLGRLATLSWIGLLCLAFVPVAYRLIRSGRAESKDIIRNDPSWNLVLVCGIWAALTWVVFYASGFLYSMAIVPLFAVLLCRHLDLRRRTQLLFCLGAVLIIMVNNLDQVMQFRAALGKM